MPPTVRSTRSSEAPAPATPKLLTKVNGAAITKPPRGRKRNPGLEEAIVRQLSTEDLAPKIEPDEHMSDVQSPPKVESAFEDLYVVVQTLSGSNHTPEEEATQIIGIYKSLEKANTAARLSLFRLSDKSQPDGKLSSWHQVNQKVLDNGCVHIWAEDEDADVVSIRVAKHKSPKQKSVPEVWMVESTVMEQYAGNQQLVAGQSKINKVECLGVFKDVESANRCALRAALALNRDDMSEHPKPEGMVDLHFKGQPGSQGKPEVKISIHAKKLH